MKVTLKAFSRKYQDLTLGNVYRVIGIEADDYRIMNDNGRPYLYPPRLFRVVDKSPSPDWEITKGPEGEKYAYPRALAEPGFFEDYFDGKRSAVSTLQTYLSATQADDKIAVQAPRLHREHAA